MAPGRPYVPNRVRQSRPARLDLTGARMAAREICSRYFPAFPAAEDGAMRVPIMPPQRPRDASVPGANPPALHPHDLLPVRRQRLPGLGITETPVTAQAIPAEDFHQAPRQSRCFRTFIFKGPAACLSGVVGRMLARTLLERAAEGKVGDAPAGSADRDRQRPGSRVAASEALGKSSLGRTEAGHGGTA